MTDSKHCTKSCTPRQRRRRWFRRGAIGLFVLLGLGGVAYAAGPMHHGHHKRPQNPDEARAHIGQVVGQALDRVDATAEQRARVDKVLDGAAPQLFTLGGEAHDLHGEVRDLLTAEKIDRAALEEARKDLVSLVDRGSKVVLGSLADTAEALTPEQRRKLADTAKRMHRE